MVDKCKSGKRIYTHWDKKSEQVTVAGKARKEEPKPAAQLTVDLPPNVTQAANGFVVHHREGEVVIDSLLTANNRTRVTSRVVLSPRAVKKLIADLAKAVR